MFKTTPWSKSNQINQIKSMHVVLKKHEQVILGQNLRSSKDPDKNTSNMSCVVFSTF